jgi:hypothetical protein
MTVGASAKVYGAVYLAQSLEQSLLWTADSICNQELVWIEDVIMSCLMVRLLPDLTVLRFSLTMLPVHLL